MLNLYEACRSGGKIIISIPNERGFPRTTKYLARPLVRKRPYGNFFEGKRELQYLRHLVQNRYIDVIREPPSDWWGHHLGFDSRRFAEFLDEALLLPGKCRLVALQASAGMFNHFYVLEKIG